MPEGSASTDKAGEIKAITVNVVKEDDTAVATVMIEKTALSPADVFQSEAQFIKAVTDDLTKDGIGYSEDFLKDGAVSSEKLNEMILAITNRAKSGIFADNPAWKQESYTIAAEAITGQESGNTAYDEDSGKVKNVKLSFKGTALDKTIDVPVRTKDKTDLIESAKVAKINDTAVDAGEAGKAVELTAGTDKDGTSFPLAVQMKLTSGAGFVDVDAKNVNWEVKAVDAQGSNETALADGLLDISVKDGALFVPQDAYVDDGEVMLKLTATVIEGTAWKEDTNKAIAFVNLKLPETVAITLKVDDEAVGDKMTFEAPAAGGSDTTINFAAEVSGSHINKTSGSETKAEITKPEGIDGKVIFADNTADKTKLAMTIKPAVDEKLNVSLEITAGKVEKTVDLEIISNKAATDAAKLSFTADDTDSVWEAPTTGENAKNGVLTIQNTTGKDVKIPITGADGRTWSTKTVKKGEEDVTGVSVKANKDGSLYLEVANTVPEIKAAYTPEGEDDKTPEVKATTWTLTLESDAENGKGQAAITRELTFDVVVKRTIEEVIVSRDQTTGSTDKGTFVDDENMTTVTLPSDEAAVLTMKAEVKGAHVESNNGVTWKIISKSAKSKAKIDAEGKLTIPQGEGIADNTIKVQATSKDKNEDGKTVSGVYTIKVVKE